MGDALKHTETETCKIKLLSHKPISSSSFFLHSLSLNKIYIYFSSAIVSYIILYHAEVFVRWNFTQAFVTTSWSIGTEDISDAALYVLLGTLMSDLGLLGVDMRYFAVILCFVVLVILSTLHLAKLNDICQLSAHS